MMKRYCKGLLAPLVLLVLVACQTHHTVETVHKVQVEPMHITIDINLKVDKALDDFFEDIDTGGGDSAPPAQ